MEYIITKKVEAKNIIEAIKKEREAEIINVEYVEPQNEEDRKYGFQR